MSRLKTGDALLATLMLGIKTSVYTIIFQAAMQVRKFYFKSNTEATQIRFLEMHRWSDALCSKEFKVISGSNLEEELDQNTATKILFGLLLILESGVQKK